MKRTDGNRAGRLGPALAALLIAALLPCGVAQGKLSVLDSPHNLSSEGGRGRSSGQPGVTFAEEGQVCVFCHVPHRAMAGTPLWSRDLPDQATQYQPYRDSSTMKATPADRPTGASRMCLSCHDGTIALNKYTGAPVGMERKMPTDPNPAFNANLSLDLRDDHPISFLYTDALALQASLVPPSQLPAEVRLEGGVSLECTACHDPHDNQYGNFLVLNNGNPARPDYQAGSPLCSTCHRPAEWVNSSHNNPVLPALSKGCLSCHMVHNAPGPVRLLAHADMEQNCLGSCHNGSDSDSANVAPLFGLSMHRHPVEYHNEVPGMDHDEVETLPAENYHVQCVDCHNPHQVNDTGTVPLSSAPQINGRLKGVRKDSQGNNATTEFDVCFKCHAGPRSERFYGVTEVRPDRLIPEPDQSRRFDSLNPSFHPVTVDRRGSGASLLIELQPNLIRIYCSDCHNSDQSAKALGGGTGPNGPHGSQYPHILMARYDMPFTGAPREPYNNSLYSLCFRCHSADFVMNGNSAFRDLEEGNLHGRHVRDQQVPCFACHDPHGVSRDRGATPENNAHLINFDKGYAGASALYTVAADGGNCAVSCHPGGQSYSRAGLPRRLLRQKSLPRPAVPGPAAPRPAVPSFPGFPSFPGRTR